MNTSTLRGIFPDPKPIHRKNFVRENIRQLKEMQGFIQQQEKIVSRSQEIKPDKFKHVAPKVYSNITPMRKLSKESSNTKRPLTHSQIVRNYRQPIRSLYSRNKQDITHRGVQTERPEDVPKLYETGVLKYPSPSVIERARRAANRRDQGDTLLSLTKQHSTRSKEQGDSPQSISKNLQKLDLEDKPNYVKQNIKNIKLNTKKREESPNPTLAPPSYHKGALPKYLKEREKSNKEIEPVEFVETENFSGLVLLPDDERKEYLRVARENYAGLIKELNSMPVSNDTLKRRRRKMEIEDELKRLDEVIKIFHKPKVFVKADT